MSLAEPVGVGSGPTIAYTTVLAPLRNGRHDPTIRIASDGFVRATITPDGPATVEVRWSHGALDVRAYGPGADHVAGRVPAMLGHHDEPVVFHDAHPAIVRAQRRHPGLRLGASGTLYHDLLPAVLAQRITAVEAFAQWRRLCAEYGTPAPGPFDGLLAPPAPDRLAAAPGWALHRLGIERRRAETLVAIARHAHHVERWTQLSSAEATGRLARLRGVGEWTIGVVLASAFGEPDAVAVGDYHLKHTVTHALTGRDRGTDDEMLDLLEPYRGQRGRVVRLLLLDGHRAPARGPRQRILPMAQW